MMPPAARQLGRSAASKTLEAISSAALPDQVLARARDRFSALTGAQRYSLAKEVAEESRSDYVRLIANLVDLVPGLRRRRSEDGTEHIGYEPCLVFLVRKKWKTSKSADRQSIPTELLRYIGPDNDRKLCAIPTDVQAERRLLEVLAQARNGVLANDASRDYYEYGAIACAVRDDAGRLYAVSAMHVLSPARIVAGRGLHGRAVESSVDGPVGSLPGSTILRSTLFGGRLVASPSISLDVQLANVVDEQGLRDALKGIRLSSIKPFVESDVELVGLIEDGRRLLILVPENHPNYVSRPRPFPRATHSTGEIRALIPFVFLKSGPGHTVQYALELQIEAGTGTTEPGDSGCPVVVPLDDGDLALVGMHIGGNPDARTSIVVPIWRILDPLQYDDVGGKMPDGALTLVDQI
jgi:hypothetical protein